MAERPLFSNCPFLGFVREFIHFKDDTATAKAPYSSLLPYFRYVRPLWFQYTAGLLCGLAASMLAMALPLATRFFVDNIVLGKETDASLPSSIPGAGLIEGLLTAGAGPALHSLYLLVLVLGVVGILIIVFNVLQSYYNVTFAEEYTFLLQADLYRHVLRFPLGYFHDRSTGYLLSRLTDDVVYLHYIFSGYLSQIVVQVVSLVLLFGLLAALSLHLTLTLLLFTPLLLVANLVFIPRVRALGFRGRDQSANVTRDLGEIISGIEQVKADSAEEREYGNLLTTIRQAVQNRVTTTVYMSLSGQVTFGVKSLALLVLFWIGGQEVLAGTMTLGDFVAFAAYVATFSTLLSSVISSPITLQPAVVSAARITEILALAPEEREHGYCPDRCSGHIRCENLAFAYTPGTPVLDGLDLDILPGRVIGIIGRTGAGKTTLINLLLKFYEPQAGQITLDGVGIGGIDSRWLRSRVSFVSQNPYLFHATIEENIRYSRPFADFEDVVLAAKRAEVHDDIMRLPDGYRTVVGEHGSKLSGGQRQRIGLARAFLKDTPVLILDEPMSHLDADIQVELMVTLSELIRGRTTIFITHHERMLAIADEVYRLVDGRLERVPGPLDQKTDLRAVNAPVPVIANQSPLFAGTGVVSIAQQDRSRSERSYPCCHIAAKIPS